MRKFAFVTTFNDAGYNDYGKICLESFTKHWDDIQLYAYYEGTEPDLIHDRITYIDLEAISPDLMAFKTKYKDDPVANGGLGVSPNGLKKPATASNKWDNKGSFLWQAVRFSHKVYTIYHAANNIDCDVLIWYDADIFTHSDVPVDFLSNFTPEDVYTCYLKRHKRYPECGFVSYNLKHPGHKQFMDTWIDLYNNDGLFKLNEWHDSYVYEQVRANLEEQGVITCHSYSGHHCYNHHPFVICELGTYMDHLKGDRKADGHSRVTDFRQQRTEDYWKKNLG